MTEIQTIDIRAVSGGIEYTWPLTLTEKSTPPVDISTDPVHLSLGSDTSPGEWRDPDTDVAGANLAGRRAKVQNQRTVQLLVGDSYKPAGDNYWLWSVIGDDPEVVPRRHQQITILADA